MANWADRCESIWLDALVSAVLLTGFSALAMVQCRQPARRRVWGRFGLVASLVAIPLVASGFLPKVDIRHPRTLFWSVGSPLRPAITASTPDIDDSTDPALVRPDTPSDEPWPPPDPSWIPPLRRGLLVAYGCGLVFSLGRFGLGLVGAWYLAKGARAASGRAEALLKSLPFAGPGRSRPRLKISERLGRPVLVGNWNPVILIPPQLDRAVAEPQLRLGLLHELAHAEMGDHRFGLVTGLAHAAWFFLPQVWWIRSQLRLDAEFLADHRAVEHFGTSYGYAESLVGLAIDPAGMTPPGTKPTPSTRPHLPPSDPLAGSGGLASALLQRVQMLLKCPFEVEDRAPQPWTWGVGALALTWTLAAACLSARDRRDLARDSIVESIQALHLEKLVIAPQLLDDRPFDLRFRLPEQFQLACEVLAEPAELGRLEILGYRLGATAPKPAKPTRAGWHRVEITRQPGGTETVHVDGTQVISAQRPANPASWLTIRPIPGRVTRFRDLHLTW